MKLCTTASELRKAISVVRPSRIAVAYVGDGWEEIVDPTCLREVIVAPVLGSNPHAIENMGKALGFENVHFLDNLHAKIFLGAKSALVGSANLSLNGFGDGGNHEIGTHLTAAVSMKRLNTAFFALKRAACRAYPKISMKHRRLAKLFREFQRAEAEGFPVAEGFQHSKRTSASAPKDISAYVVWHLCWYSDDNPEYNERAIRSSVSESKGERLDDFIEDCMPFLENDEVNEGDWILYWKCNAKGMPLARGDLDWMFVHHVVSNGADELPYTKLAFQSSKKKCPREPFLLTKDVKSRIKELIRKDEFKSLRPTLPLDKTRWSLREVGQTFRKYKRAFLA